jgi:hypothetical protein
VKSFFSCIAALCLFGISITNLASGQARLAFAKTGPAPGEVAENPDGSMKTGWFLESRFQPYFKECSPGGVLPKKGGINVSTVPLAILSSPTFDPWSWVYKPTEYTAANAFSIIGPTQSLPATYNGSDHLAMDPLQDPVSMLPPGTSRVIYSANCTGILAASLNADAGVKFPFEQLTAIMKADYTNTNHGELGVISGVFSSPFFQLYSQQLGGPSGSAYAHFLLWDWYRTHYSGTASVPTETFYMLKWFKGFSMYWVHKASRADDGSVKLSASAGLVGASASTAASAEYQSYGSTYLENFEIAMLVKQPAMDDTSHFESVDSVDKLVNWSTHNAFAVFSAPAGFSSLLQQNAPERATHEDIIVGVPDSLCNYTLWSANPDATTTANMKSLAVTGHRAIPAPAGQLAPSCALTVKYVPADAVFNLASGSVVNVKYSLVTKIGDKTLETPQVAVNFNTSPYPAISPKVFAPTAFDPNPPLSGGGYTLQWKLALSLQEDPADRIDPTAAVTPLQQPQFGSCTVLTGNPPGIPAGGISFGMGTDLNITINQFVRFPSMPDPAAATNSSCTVSLTLRFKTVGGNFVSAALPQGLNVLYPVTPAPAQPTTPILPARPTDPAVPTK